MIKNLMRETIFLGSQLRQWSIAFIIFLTSLFILNFFKKFILKKLTESHHWKILSIHQLLLDLVKRIKKFFIFTWALYIGFFWLSLPPEWYHALQKIVFLASMVQISIWGNCLVSFWVDHYIQKKAAHDTTVASAMGLLRALVQFLVYGILILLTLDNFGIDITALLTTLGLGGLAITLALQNILSDLFASLTIVLDRPFVVGDFIVVDDLMGTIERIGLRTTHIRSLSGEQLIFSNADLLKSKLRNFKRMQERRVIFPLYLAFDTPEDKLKKVTKIISEIVKSLIEE